MGKIADFFNAAATGFTIGVSTGLQKYAESLPQDSGLRKIFQTFSDLLPSGGGKKSEIDEALIVKTSPTIWEYEMFRLEWERRAILREIDIIMRSDPRIKRANRVFANAAVRGGMTITVTSDINKTIEKNAQQIIDDFMRDCQINSKLTSWARLLLKEGDLILNPVIDVQQRKVINIKRLPAISIQRNDDMTGNFPNPEEAFRQIDPISLQTLMTFPLWAINHIRWDHEEGERYGNSQYLQIRGYWKKLNMTEEDLVVRRRTRAVPRRLHSVGTKDHPGDWSEVETYKSKNNLSPKNTQITTDYFGNGLTTITDLNADAQLDHIADVEHLQEVYAIGTATPIHLFGFGKGVNRDVVEDQKAQFKEDTQELRDLLEYGDSSPYSGFRVLFDFALALGGVNPKLVEYNVSWFQQDSETAKDHAERVTKVRNPQHGDPIISAETALRAVAKDYNLETETAIQAELEKLSEEKDEKLNLGLEPDEDTFGGRKVTNGEKAVTDSIESGKGFFHSTDERRGSLSDE